MSEAYALRYGGAGNAVPHASEGTVSVFVARGHFCAIFNLLSGRLKNHEKRFLGFRRYKIQEAGVF
jgi:hypothetical protein